jgi:alcohol dehydrogenase, propanol-preferring
VCIGLPADVYLKAPVFGTVIRMVSIKGSYVGNRRDSAEAIEFFRRGGISIPIKASFLKKSGIFWP